VDRDDASKLREWAGVIGVRPVDHRPDLRRWVTWHEAAHAVVAQALGMPIREVRIERFAGAWWRGVVAYEAFGPKLAARERVETILAAKVAGPWGDQLRLGGCYGHRLDVVGAVRYAINFVVSGVVSGSPVAIPLDWRTFERVRMMLERASERALLLLHRHEAAWAAIARALKTRRHLSGDEVSELFAETSRGPRPQRRTGSRSCRHQSEDASAVARLALVALGTGAGPPHTMPSRRALSLHSRPFARARCSVHDGSK
jgi:hypothetical protein